MFDMTPRSGESEEMYLWRIGRAKDSGVISDSWDDLSAIINAAYRSDPTEYRTSSAYRKRYSQARQFYDAGVFNNCTGDVDALVELREQRYELEKERVKIRDERNELRRLLREQARSEGLSEQLARAVENHKDFRIAYEPVRNKGVNCGDTDLIISCTDLHTGLEIDNFCNTFNNEVLLGRLGRYNEKINEIAERHDSKDAYVILSEVISGLIHNELRIESNQTVIEQFLTAVDCIAHFLESLSYRFQQVHVYVSPGNHSRLSQKKEDSRKGENLDHLLIPFLKAKLQNFKNMNFHENEIEESVAMFNVRGKTVMCAHGDKDEPSTVVQKFTMMFGVKPDLVYLGHRHTNSLTTVYDSKVIQSGCMSGSDTYCMDKRLRNKPEQMVSVVNDNGLECLYDIKFD